MINGFAEAVKRVKHAIEYGFHCNDMTYGEIEDDICFAFDKLAKDNGEPETNWEEEDSEEDS
jgi:hypothetical protein